MQHDNSPRHLSRYGRFGALLAAIGVLLAIDAYFEIAFLFKLWPILIAILGAGFVGIYKSRSRREPMYIGAGAYLIQFSGLALYFSLTSWSESASLWPLFIAFAGVAFLFAYFFGRRQSLTLLLGLLFISISVVFIFVFALSAQLWWTVFVLTGASFLIFDIARRPR
jgi:hypothetical protein